MHEEELPVSTELNLKPWVRAIMFAVITGALGFASLYTDGNGQQAKLGPPLIYVALPIP
jgi:hypothetical protein